MDRKIWVSMLLVLVLLGGAMVSIAAFVGKNSGVELSIDTERSTGKTGQEDFETLVRNLHSSRVLGGAGDQGGFYDISAMPTLINMFANISRVNISISSTAINGTLVYIEKSVMFIESGQKMIKVAVYPELFNGERVLSLQELIFLKEINKGDSLSIKAINITISSKDGLVVNIYLASEIRDLTTGKTFTTISPINMG